MQLQHQKLERNRLEPFGNHQLKQSMSGPVSNLLRPSEAMDSILGPYECVRDRLRWRDSLQKKWEEIEVEKGTGAPTRGRQPELTTQLT